MEENDNTNAQQLEILNLFLDNKFKNINELSDENNIRLILKKIEPNIEKIGGDLNLIKDSKLGVRYVNLDIILDCINKYFEDLKL